ncbi:NAD-dependent histone deacetylase HST3 [Madurella mycetomatis]|uniref:NAD-dependent histone deacetylase HST3 n=1 Tax=Madurella mycetomatis TaxID=100816 RepID=A0A175W1D7_9PEZI|nr:NAD-dependent histone deacetylase HST3 [Madurella mycetomatis]
MPTTHVEPGSESLLQEIANSLSKARKVVVITGAGISTNSGIPDFRSENGLYSLIQAQFDAAHKQAAGSNGDVDVSDAVLEERPAKRRRVSRAGSPGVETALFPGLRGTAKHAAANDEQGGQQGEEMPSETADETRHSSNSGSQQDMTTTDQEPALTPLPSPRLVANQIEVVSEPLAEDSQAPFASSPPRLAQETLRRPDLIDLQTRSSSPLSSPPPVTFDPYEESLGTSSSSSNHDSASSRSQSEEPSSVSTPLLTSQTSFSSSSGRASLPNMKGRDLFDARIWSCPIKTSVFYTFATTLRQKVRCAEPTSSHHFVSILRDSRKLVRCYTQNIDQLEERVGLTTSLSLGAGNRYRFSARAGRKLDGSRSSLKNAESSIESSQGASQKEEEQQGGTQSQEQPQPSRTVMEPSQTEDKDAPSNTVQASQSGSESGSAQNDIPTSTPSTQTAVSAPPAPNRGVECVFLHGSLAELRCFVCARTASWDDETRQADTLAGRQPICPHCAGATAAREERGKRALGVGKLRPDIVLYGEEHPHAHLISPLVQHDLSLGPDMLLILGTSMRVHGLKVLVREFAKAVHDRGGKVVFVNFTKPPESVWADIIDFWVQWDCDAWVGDLQARKPSLWLPPGAALPEDEKPKHTKAIRRQNGEASKRDGVDKPSRRGRESDGMSRNQKRESSGLLIAQETEKDGLSTQSQEMLPPPPPPQAASNKPIRVPRERKLNPNAKRPASVRDHKLNGAYLVWKILQDLRRITDGNPIPPATNSPSGTSAKPRSKRLRKSSAAVIESVDVKTEQSITVDPTGATKQDIPASLAPPRLPDMVVETVVSNEESSISAAVKSRKRKQAVTWRMINGVETRVSLNDAGDEAPSPLPHTNATFGPSPQPQSQPQPEPHNFRALPRPTPAAPLPAAASPPPRPVPQADHNATAVNTTNLFATIDNGFRETDRLIAQLHQESSAVFMPRPSTPPVRLAPLNIPPVSGPVPHTLRQGASPKLATLEPKVTSPGPQAAISCDVGSPVAAAAAASHARMQLGGVTGPFSLADPLAGWLSFPPRWMEQQGQQQGQGQARAGYEREWYPHRHAVGCGPDEQLRKEQEAALMLSALREGSRG